MERNIAFEQGEYYHVYNRGVNHNPIFFADADWKHFQRLLYLRNDARGHIRPDRCKTKVLQDIDIPESLVNIQAYTLMPNHFHLLLSENREGGISKFMSKLLTSYSMYVNKKYNRSGPLMCRPFRSKHVNSDEYLRWVISYIHLNPLAYVVPDWEEKGIDSLEEAKDCIRNYHFSSYVDYFEKQRDESVIINKESLPIFIAELEDVPNMIDCYSSTPR